MLWRDSRIVSIALFVPPPFEEMMCKGRFMPTATQALKK